MPPVFSKELSEPTVFASCLNRQNRTSPCEAACPAGMPIQKIHSMIGENNMEEAYRHVLSRNPFSGVTGRVCPHPCEGKCNRHEFDEAVSIRGLERFASDNADLSRYKGLRKKPASGKRVAIIGSGPAGLTAAYFSALFGHQVTLYEASATLGGMMKLGVPDFRLPKHVVDREIGAVLALGIDVRTNTVVGRDVDLGAVMKEHDACLIAVGAWKEKRLGIPGAETAESGLSFLKAVNLGRREAIGQTVVVLGGGGVAFDCAFAARRLGAKEVHVVCVEGEDCLLAPQEDIIQAKRENIAVHAGHLASKVLTDGSKPTGIEYFAISSFSFDECGALSYKCEKEERKILPADAVIMAVGLGADLGVLGSRHNFNIGPRGTIAVNPTDLTTSVKGVFAAGDVSFGPGSIARAVGEGRLAAVAMNNYLSPEVAAGHFEVTIDDIGEIVIKEQAAACEAHVVTFKEILNIDHYDKKDRMDTVQAPEAKATLSFDEIDRGFGGTDEAISEAGRCFHCGHCQLCGKCVEDCPGYVLAMSDNGPTVVYPEECWHCGNCRISCPSSAVSYKFPISMMV